MGALTLPIADIIQVNVSPAAVQVASKSFNQGLIVGPSTAIPSYGANSRLRQYASAAAMIADGFTALEAEYIAAALYFSQASNPQFVWIGRQDLTAIGTATVDVGGTGYVVGDVVTVTQAGGSNGNLTVLAVTAGVVTSVGTTVGNQGTGYALAVGLTTTGGTGTGLTVTITALGESFLEAVEACALANNSWYGVMCCGAVDADHLALAAWSTTNWQTGMYFGSSADAGIPAGTPANIALQLQTLKNRAFLSYNTTQSALYPNNIYAAAAILGEYCGLNTGLAGSSFTLNLKSLTGIAPEPLSQTQYATITAANCNTVASFGPYDGYLVTGILSSGEFFDQIMYRAMLVNQIQTNLMNLLISVPKVPQTNAGEHLLIGQVDQACSNMANIGYLGAGTWRGAAVLNLQDGDVLPLGYLSQAAPYSQQSSGDRAARKAMPIYCAILEAGAVHSVVIQVNTQI